MATAPAQLRRRLTADQARRAFLAAVGLARPRPASPDVRHLRRVWRDLDVVQIDPINVLARAHHQVLMSRLGPHDTDAADRYLWRSGEIWEGWIHVDATGPVDMWPLLAHRRAKTLPWRAVQAVMDERPGYMDAVLEEVAERGELTAAQLRDPGERLGSWGGRSMGRAALDYLHHRGDLAISWRDDRMTTHFDLTERVIPAEHLQAPVPEEEEAMRQLLLRAVRAVSLGTAADLADHHRQHVPTCRRLLRDLAAEGLVDRVDVQGWPDDVYADPAIVVPRRVAAATLLNPFDPALWNRARLTRLFDLDYTVEIYVPAAKRRYGYYVLPLLSGDRITALVDLKHDRSAGVLVVAAAHLHEGDADAEAAVLAAELDQWRRWVGAEDIRVADAGDLAGPLRRALAGAGRNP